jgi:hypothetical protein
MHHAAAQDFEAVAAFAELRLRPFQNIESLIGDSANTLFVSVASAWEVCTKVRIGGLPTGRALMPAAASPDCFRRRSNILSTHSLRFLLILGTFWSFPILK